MAKVIHYACPDCGGTFKHFRILSDEGPPDRCALCGSWMNMDEPPQEVFVPTAPAIRKNSYVKGVDQSYRAMEESSAQRSAEAADMLRDAYSQEDKESPHEGDPRIVEEFRKNQINELTSGLKLTDMADPMTMRSGDTAVAGSLATPEAQRLSVAQKPGFAANGMENFTPGPDRNAEFVQRFTQNHTNRALGMIRSGEMGRHT